ncbi:MAG: hypothetical protein C4332_05035 [Meiothermus sp.]
MYESAETLPGLACRNLTAGGLQQPRPPKPPAEEDPAPTLNGPGFSWTATTYTFADDGPQAQAVPPQGLKAEYLDNADFTGEKIERTDAPVNFNWSSGVFPPHVGMNRQGC